MRFLLEARARFGEHALVRGAQPRLFEELADGTHGATLPRLGLHHHRGAALVR